MRGIGATGRRRRGWFAIGPWTLPLAAAALLFVALALFGARWHWVEEAGSAERDGYVAEAEAILAGELPRDPYRPALYPLLVAALARPAGDAFTAARTLSNLAAAALALLAFAFGRRLAGDCGEPPGAAGPGPAGFKPAPAGPAGSKPARAGWWAFALVAANPNLWILGQHVTTDMLFAALAAAALLAGLVYLEAPGWRPALAAGAALGLAAFTRGNALFLVPGLALGWWLAPPRSTDGRAGGRRVAHLVALAAVALVLLAPHFALRAAVFGDPFHDENWKNLAWKLDGYPDWSALGRIDHDGPAELLSEESGAVLASALTELARFAGSGLAQLLGTPLHVLALLAGATAALAWRRRPAAWLLAAAGCFLAGVAVVFFTWGRLLLVLLPIAAALTASPTAGAVGRRLGRRLAAGAGTGRPPSDRAASILRRAPLALAVVLVALLALKTFAFRLPDFVERHPYREVAVARRVAAATPPGTVLAGTSPFLGRYLERRWIDLPDAGGEAIGDPVRYLEQLHRLVADEGIDYLVVGRLDLRGRPASLLADEPPVPWLAAAGGDQRVRVWRVLER
ncbi:MAG TPA: glycosyltransferase family 39 protein [Thermoanaerobaculia bacterium]|nr:glycosyltransferase family 39 protein [Thermoanaerobaculia bacterium]